MSSTGNYKSANWPPKKPTRITLKKCLKILAFPFVYIWIILVAMVVGFRWSYDILFFDPNADFGHVKKPE